MNSGEFSVGLCTTCDCSDLENKSQFASSVLYRAAGNIWSVRFNDVLVPLPVTENRIPLWSEPRAGSTSQSCTLLAKEFVTRVRSITVSLVMFERKKVPHPGVFSNSSRCSSIQSTRSSAPGPFCPKGSHQG